MKNKITEFLNSKKQLRVKTQSAYLYELNHFTKENKIKTIDDINQENVNNYLLKFNSATKNRKAVVLKSFLNFIGKNIIVNRDKIERKKGVQDLSNSDVKSFLTEVYLHKNSRDIAIFDLWFTSGLRVGEMTEVNQDFINFKDKVLYVNGKGGIERIIPIDNKAIKSLSNYFIGGFKFEFQSRKGGKITTRGLQHLCYKYSELSGIKKFFPNMIRKTVATRLELLGIPRILLKRFLGHTIMDMTESYINFNRLELNYENFFNDYPIRETILK